MARKKKYNVVRLEGPPLAIDEPLQGADWPKRTWDLPQPGTPEYEALREWNGPLRPAFPGAEDGRNL